MLCPLRAILHTTPDQTVRSMTEGPAELFWNPSARQNPVIPNRVSHNQSWTSMTVPTAYKMILYKLQMSHYTMKSMIFTWYFWIESSWMEIFARYITIPIINSLSALKKNTLSYHNLNKSSFKCREKDISVLGLLWWQCFFIAMWKFGLFLGRVVLAVWCSSYMKFEVEVEVCLFAYL